MEPLLSPHRASLCSSPAALSHCLSTFSALGESKRCLQGKKKKNYSEGERREDRKTRKLLQHVSRSSAVSVCAAATADSHCVCISHIYILMTCLHFKLTDLSCFYIYICTYMYVRTYIQMNI